MKPRARGNGRREASRSNDDARARASARPSTSANGGIWKSKVTCFGCRRSGHTLRDCRNHKGGARDGVRGTKTCYNCGKENHAARDCTEAWSAYAHASCFVCGETGHLSKACEKNAKGVYVNGGECKICKAKDHLVKDCPHKGDTCIRCGEKGHFAASCTRTFQRQGEKASAPTTGKKTEFDAPTKRASGGDDLEDDFDGNRDEDGEDEVEASVEENATKTKPKTKKQKREVVF